jgi:hypothetical protein
MHFADLVRSFLPLRNPIGFGASDFIELIIGGLLILAAVGSRSWIEPYLRRLAPKTGWCMLLLAILPVALRLALLPNHPVPAPDIYDEFSHLLVADTLRHFRFANPAHPLHQFFETFFVLQQPTYSSIYPLGQGLSMAAGRMLFGTAWAGVLLSTSAFCALCYWMLRGWTTAPWALLGGFLAVVEFGPLNQWMNSYWGGAFSAAGGCLVFGALPRLREAARTRDASLLGLGLGLQLITRPYEFIFLFASAVLFLLPLFRKPAKLAPAILVLFPAIALTLLQNKQVTGSWSTLPYMLSQYEYGVPAALTFQSSPVPHNDLTPQQQLDYKMQLAFGPSGGETIETYLTRLAYRVRFYRFFFLPPLYVALVCFLFALPDIRFAYVALTLLIFALGSNFFPSFQFHYIAAVTCLFVLVSVTGLQQLSRLTIRGWHTGQEAAWLIVCLCAVHFVFFYGLHVFDTADFSIALRRYETWDAINHGNPERRIEINRQLAKTPGPLLVLVRYSPQHIFQDEWVYNEADIDRARIVWARDLGAVENQKLQNYYPDRAVWLLEPDARPPRLSRYMPEPPTPTPLPTPLRLEQVH